jgi:hypothetical protein
MSFEELTWLSKMHEVALGVWNFVERQLSYSLGIDSCDVLIYLLIRFRDFLTYFTHI